MLTRKQYKFLKSLLKKDTKTEDIQDKENEIYTYLLKRKLIENYLVCPPGDIMQKYAVEYCKITEDGKIELLLCKQNWYHFWLPTIISIIALLVSLLPIVCSYVQTIICQSAS